MTEQEIGTTDGKDDKIENAREVLEQVMRALNEIEAASVARC